MGCKFECSYSWVQYRDTSQFQSNGDKVWKSTGHPIGNMIIAITSFRAKIRHATWPLNSNKRQMKWRQTAWRWVKYRQGQGLLFKNAKQPCLKFRRQRTYVTVLLAYKATLQNAEIHDQWSLTEGRRFRESNHKGSLPRRGSDTSTFVFFMLENLLYAIS